MSWVRVRRLLHAYKHWEVMALCTINSIICLKRERIAAFKVSAKQWSRAIMTCFCQA